MAQDALRPGGVFILEAYTPRQVAFGTGLVLVVLAFVCFFDVVFVSHA